MKRIYTPTRRKKILIVDDDQFVASIYQDQFERERYDVEIASNAESALQMLAKKRVDLVILDFSLPGMNGVEVLREIRSTPGAEALLIIVLLNAYLPGLAEAAAQGGANRSVIKTDCTPCQMMEIVGGAFAGSPAKAIPSEVVSGVGSAPAPTVDLPADHTSKTHPVQSATEFQAEVVAAFLNNAPQNLARLCSGHHAFASTQQENLRLTELFEMHRQARLLAGAAAVCGIRKIAQLASALEALLIQLYGKPTNITPSVIRTIAQATDLLASLFDHATRPEPEVSVSPAILVVDDEIISRETICSALQKGNLAAISLDDSLAAQRLLEHDHFDLIFLDVEMPGQSGFELCAKIREMAANSATPVVFVTAHSGFDSRAQSSLSGGNDFIAKPFLSVELAVKALTWLFKEKAQPLSIAASHGGNIDERHTAETGLEQHSHENKTNRPHAFASSITSMPKSASVRSDPNWIQFRPPWESARNPNEPIAARFDKMATIVIADDDPVSIELVSTTVNQWGFHTVVTHDGHEAMAAIRAENGPVVAILDWMMPGMDGLEVCRRVRQIGRPVYVILLTARAAKENLVEALESGADDYLVKPFDKNELHARVHVGMRIMNLQNALSEHVAELEKALLEVEELRSKVSISL